MTNTSVWRQYGRHGQMFTPRSRMEKLVRAGEEVPDSWRSYGGNLLLYPNSMVLPTPDHVEFWTVWPALDGAASSTTHIRFFVRPDLLDDRMRERMDRSWEILSQAAMEEDWPMEQWIQANAKANPSETFLYGRHEQTCQHLHRQLDRDLSGS
jgi:hypothetical protein